LILLGFGFNFLANVLVNNLEQIKDVLADKTVPVATLEECGFHGDSFRHQLRIMILQLRK